jgi:hypothetical protein
MWERKQRNVQTRSSTNGISTAPQKVGPGAAKWQGEDLLHPESKEQVKPEVRGPGQERPELPAKLRLCKHCHGGKTNASNKPFSEQTA